MATYSDTFSGTNGTALGNTEVGGKPWQVISGTWTRNGGRAYTSTSSSSNPIAVIDAGTSRIDATVNVSNGGGDALYFKVVDANNWFRMRMYTFQNSSTYYYTEYQIADAYYEYEWRAHWNHSGTNHRDYPTNTPNPGGVFEYYWHTSSTSQPTGVFPYEKSVYHTHNSGTFAHTHIWYRQSITLMGGGTGNPRLAVSGYYWSTSSDPDGSGPDYWTGSTRSSPSTSYYTDYRVYLDRCINGSVSTLGTYSSYGSTFRVVTDGSSILGYVDGTLRFNLTDSNHSTATRHGIGRASTSYDSSAIDNFSLTTINLVPTAPTNLSASGTFRAGKTAGTISWTHNDPDGHAQSKYRLRYQKVGDSTWTTLSDVTTSTQSMSLLFPQASVAGDYYVQVATSDAEGFGPWSNAIVVNVLPFNTAPTVQWIPDHPEIYTEDAEISWLYSDEDDNPHNKYQVRIRRAL